MIGQDFGGILRSVPRRDFSTRDLSVPKSKSRQPKLTAECQMLNAAL
jgi:hypothetical protein